MTNILVYTVCNNSYIEKLKMMLNSFLTHNTIDIHVLTCDFDKSFISKNTDNQVIAHNVSDLYQEYKDNFKRPSYACKRMKSSVNQFINTESYDIVIYTDCDVLFYKNINSLIEKLDLDKINMSYDGSTYRRYTPYNICTGFFVFNPKIHTNLLFDWDLNIMHYIQQKSKYIDQPAMRTLMKQDSYQDKFTLISLEDISMKYKRSDTVATHYINRRSHNMFRDYGMFFNHQYDRLDINE